MRRDDRGWIVTAVLPKFHPFRAGFFPRQLCYKVDAEKLADEVRAAGGTPAVHRAKDYHKQARIADSPT